MNTTLSNRKPIARLLRSQWRKIGSYNGRLYTYNSKSHMGFRLVSISMTLNELERP